MTQHTENETLQAGRALGHGGNRNFAWHPLVLKFYNLALKGVAVMRHFVLLLATFLCCFAYAQQGHDLRIETYFLPNERASKSVIAVRFTNITSHELDLPTDNVYVADRPIPGSNFKGLYYPKSIFSCLPIPGSISVSFQFKPQDPEVITRCGEVAAVELTAETPTVLQRAKSWTILEPGESTTRQAIIASVLPIQAGKFMRIRAVYSGPHFSPDELEQLKKAGVRLPAGDSTSDNSFGFWTDGDRVTLLDANGSPRRILPELGPRPEGVASLISLTSSHQPSNALQSVQR